MMLSYRWGKWVWLAGCVGGLVGLGAVGGLAAERKPAWPEITQTARPWTRWWWPGSLVTQRTTTALLASYAKAGLGGVEITPIYGVRGREAEFIPYLSGTWMGQLRHAVSEAQRLGLGVDMATGTGWPFGGPWIGDEAACRTLLTRTYQLKAGEKLTEPVTARQEAFLRTVGGQLYELHGQVYQKPGEKLLGTAADPAKVAGGPQVRIEDLVEPVAANRDLQALALDQVKFSKAVPLVALVAHAANGSWVDLTSRVDASGRLDWIAPEGDWTLYALFAGWHGKMVERAAPGGEGNVVDHFSARALTRHLERFDEAFAGQAPTGLRAFFNDSYEVDDAKGQADWTPELLEEFSRRRGYDLRGALPAWLANDDSPASARVRSDFRETISDLLREAFTGPWREWAHRQGALVRNQAHGSPANILDLYAASDIPEQEGNDVLAMKLASSAAHLTGKRLVSAEAATWLDEHFTSTLGDLRRCVDRFFLGGINHVYYHGTMYSAPGEKWPGFQFYAAMELNPANPVWADFPAVNAYVARVQAYLQTGCSDEGVLVYYNIHDQWAERGEMRLPHFYGRPLEKIGARTTLERLRAAGYGGDYFSDRLLAGLVAEGASLRAGETVYGAVVVPATTFMPLATLERLAELAEGGRPVIFEGQVPAAAPGERGVSERAAYERVRERVQALAAAGRVMIVDDAATALASCSSVRRERLGETGLAYVRRRSAEGAYYLLVNTSDRPVDGWVPLASPAAGAVIFDPMDGRCGRAAWRATSAGTEVYLQLAPGESRLVQLYGAAVGGAAWAYARPVGEAQPLAGEWSVTFADEGRTPVPASAQLTALGSWTEWGGEAGKNFAGTATYRVSWARPKESAAAWRLDLGDVADSARVSVNGRELVVLLQAPWTVDIPADVLRENNEIVVQVTNLAANGIADLDRRGVPWKNFYNVNMAARRAENRGADGLFTAAAWQPRPAGLLGPVVVTPLRVFSEP